MAPDSKLADTVKFLELLISECDNGTDDHAWRKCSRCLAILQIQDREALAEGFIRMAIASLKIHLSGLR
jgi:hypothetical protein